MLLRMREERLKRGWSLTRLSGKTGIAAGDLSAVERGLRVAFPGWRRRIARAFRMSARDLFSPVEWPAGELAAATHEAQRA